MYQELDAVNGSALPNNALKRDGQKAIAFSAP